MVVAIRSERGSKKLTLGAEIAPAHYQNGNHYAATREWLFWG
jgi:hypothetical protein